MAKFQEEMMARLAPAQEEPKISRATIVSTRGNTALDSPNMANLLSPATIANLQRLGYTKISRPTIRVTQDGLEGNQNDWILIDNCANVHDIAVPTAAYNVREVSERQHVNTIAGTCSPKMMCDVPFLGEAFFNPNGSFTVLSLGLLRRNIHVWIEPKGVLEADIHFIPFAYVLKARWRSDDVMGANGAELFNLWETHPYSKGLPEGYNPGLARRKYLMSLPEGKSKASKHALDDCNSWIARASSSRGSPTSQLELVHTRPTVEMIDSASMYSAQASGNAARARSGSRSDDESEQDQNDYPEGADQGLREIIFHNFQHKVDEAPMLVEIAMDGAQWWPDSCKLKYTDPVHAGDLVRARVGVMNSWREPGRPLLDVEELGDRAEEEVAAKNRRLYDFVTHFMRKDRREVEAWQSEYLRREEADATELRNRKELR